MKIKLIDETEYELEQLMMSKSMGEEDSKVLTLNLSNKIKSSDFFENVERDFTDENTREMVFTDGEIEVVFKPKSIVSKMYTTNNYGNQTTVVFKN